MPEELQSKEKLQNLGSFANAKTRLFCQCEHPTLEAYPTLFTLDTHDLNTSIELYFLINAGLPHPTSQAADTEK